MSTQLNHITRYQYKYKHCHKLGCKWSSINENQLSKNIKRRKLNTSPKMYVCYHYVHQQEALEISAGFNDPRKWYHYERQGMA